MNRDHVLSRYDREMRRRPYLSPDIKAQLSGGVLRITGAYNCIPYTDLCDEDAEAAIDAQLAFFQGKEVEWKVHGHDRPANLGQRLAAKGFQPDPAETLLAIDLATPLPPAPRIAGLVIRQIGDPAGLDDYIAAATAGFGVEQPYLREAFRTRLSDPTLAIHVAYVDGVPVGAGRVDLPPGRPFAGLYGGGVAPAFRGRGIYRALIEVRAEAARAAGHEFAMVEALETSRPILERLGFTPLTTVQGWLLRPA